MDGSQAVQFIHKCVKHLNIILASLCRSDSKLTSLFYFLTLLANNSSRISLQMRCRVCISAGLCVPVRAGVMQMVWEAPVMENLLKGKSQVCRGPGIFV